MTQCTLLYHLYIMLGEEETKKKRNRRLYFFYRSKNVVTYQHRASKISCCTLESQFFSFLVRSRFCSFLSHLINHLLKLCWFYVKCYLEHHQITKLPLRFVRAVVCRLTSFFLINISHSLSRALQFSVSFSINFLIKHDN